MNPYFPNSKNSEKLPCDRELMHAYCVKISCFYHVLTIHINSGHNRKLSFHFLSFHFSFLLFSSSFFLLFFVGSFWPFFPHWDNALIMMIIILLFTYNSKKLQLETGTKI
jgi:hypothetical protein